MKFSVRRSIIGFVLLAQVLTVGALVVSSGRATREAASDQAASVLRESSNDVAQRTESYVAPAAVVATFAASALGSAAISPNDLETVFLAAMSETPQLDGVYYGAADGAFFYVSRVEGGIRVKEISFTEGEREASARWLDFEGREVEREVLENDTYDPRLRPWYGIGVAGDGSLDWTDPYVFFTSGRLGITVSRGVVVDGDVVGVVGADIELGTLSEFLSTVRVGESGNALIVNDQGTVLAHPDPSLLSRQTRDGVEPVSIAALEDPLARSAIASVIASGDLGMTSANTEVDGTDVLAAFRSIPIGSGQWTIMVYGDEEEIIPGLIAAESKANQLRLIVGLLSLTLVALVAWPAAKAVGSLERHARTDALTGLPNRRSILAVAEKVAASSNSNAFVMLDLDNFKSVNDTHGHQVGDEVLRVAAGRLARSLRVGDRMGRVGGEEFLIVLDGATRDAVETVIERALEALRAAPIETSGGPIDVTVSAGAAVASGPKCPVELSREADEALLRAKSTGKNRLVIAGIAIVSPVSLVS